MLIPLFIVYFKYASQTNKRYLVMISFLFSISMSFTKGFIIRTLDPFQTIFTFFIPYIPYFLAGGYLRGLKEPKIKPLFLKLAFLIAAFLTVMLNYWYMLYTGFTKTLIIVSSNYSYFLDYFSPNVVIMSLILFILAARSKKLESIKNTRLIIPVRQLSAATFGIYLVHPLILDFLDRFTFLDLARIPRPVWIFLAIKICITFILSFAAIIALKKLPFIKDLIG